MEITATAQNKLRSLLPQPDRAFRIKALPGGCKGFTYDLKIIQQPSPDDVFAVIPGFAHLHRSPKSALFRSCSDRLCGGLDQQWIHLPASF